MWFSYVDLVQVIKTAGRPQGKPFPKPKIQRSAAWRAAVSAAAKARWAKAKKAGKSRW